jgi:hypothetical protein
MFLLNACRRLSSSAVLVKAELTVFYAVSTQTEPRRLAVRPHTAPGKVFARTPEMSEISPISGSRKVTKKGFIIYEVTVSHNRLGMKAIIRGQFPSVLERKAQAKAAQWDAIWEKRRQRDSRRPKTESSSVEAYRKAENSRLNLGTSN